MFMELHVKPALMDQNLILCKCGGDPFVDWWSPIPGKQETFVRCQKCGKIGPSADSEDGAILAWNAQTGQ